MERQSGVLSSPAPRRVRRPAGNLALHLALGSLILSFVWRIQDLFPIVASLRFPLLATVLGFGWFFANGGVRRLQPLWRQPVVAASVLLLALMFLGVPGSLFQGLSLNFITKDFIRTLALMLAVAAAVRAVRDVERLLVIHLAGAAAFAWLTLTRFTVGANGRLDELGYYDANDLGMLMVMVLPMAIYLLRPKARTSPMLKLFALVCVALFALTITKTGSRGAFLALLAVSAYLLFRFKAIKPGIRFAAVAGAFVVLLGAGGSGYIALMKTLLNPTADYNWSGGDDTGRMEIWKRGMTYMMDNPITGVGARCFSVAEGTLSPQAALQEYGVGFKWSEAHNAFVQIGAELGVFGLLLFLGQLAAAFIALREVQRRSPGNSPEARTRRALAQSLTASLLGYIVAAFFLSQAYAAVLYVVLGMVVALWKLTPGTTRTNASSAMATVHG